MYMEKLKRLHSGQSSEARQITFKLINNGSNVGKVMNENHLWENASCIKMFVIQLLIIQ